MRAAFERRGKKVNKGNFLSVHGEAHVKALTPELIRAAFKKTGVVPFNRNVVTQDMMAPSLESSSRGSLPLQTSPVRAVARLIANEVTSRTRHARAQGTSTTPPNPTSPTSDHPPTPSSPPRTPRARAGSVVRVLTTTSAAYLVSPSPIPTNAIPPRFHAVTVSPMKRRYSRALDREPSTAYEGELQDHLRKAHERENVFKQVIFELQAASVLHSLFVDRVHDRLEGQGEKEESAPKKRKLLGNGLPKLLTQDEIFSVVAEHEAEQERERELQAKKKADTERHKKALAAWKVLEKARDERVKAQRDRFQKEMDEWAAEKLLAKQEGRKVELARPVLGPIEAKPKGKPTRSNRRKKAAPVSNQESESEEREVDGEPGDEGTEMSDNGSD